MNINTLSKCVEELKKDTPNISYILGMLETVIEMNGAPVYPYAVPSSPISAYPVTTAIAGSGLVDTLTDEEIIAQRYAGGRVAELGTI